MSPATELPAAPPRVGAWRRRLQRGRRAHALLLQLDGLWDAGQPGAPLQPSRWHESFDHWCTAHPDADCELLLSGTLVHDIVCDPALPLRSDAQLIEHARAVFTHYHGEAATTWPMACWFSGPHFGVSALHGCDVAALQASAAGHGVRIRRMQPWWSRILGLTLHRLQALDRTPQAWLIALETGFASALCLRQGRLADIRTQWLPGSGAQALETLAAQLLATDGDGSERPVVLATGFGLASSDAAGVEVLGRLDEPGPSGHWLLRQRDQP